jgi:predicted phosphoribosyltransferase
MEQDAAVGEPAIPEWFGAVGAFYQYFPQISDDEVVLLMESAAPVPSHQVRNT